jgi:putative ABC transport system permease protein
MSFLDNKRRQSELEEEVRGHLEMSAQERMERGQSSAEANHEARHEFGNVSLVQETARDMWGSRWFEDLFDDARYGVRMLWKKPGFTVVAVLTLALGIGANAAIFSLVNGILLTALPFSHPEQLVSVTGAYPQGAFVAMREQIHSMDVAAYAEGHELNLTGQGDPVRLTATYVSAEFFSVLGAQPELGRTFLPHEDVPGQDDFVILSHSLWQQRFMADPNIIDRSIELSGVSRRIVGVMPATFRYPSTKTQVWIPLHNDSRSIYTYWAGDFMPVVARLHPGTTIERARSDISIFQTHVFSLFPWPMPKTWNPNVSVVPLQDGMVSDVRARLLLLLGSVALVLLIACANVANLSLSRNATREREIAVRSALGASRHRIARQLLTESLVLASLGGAAGLLLAVKGLIVLKTFLPADTPRLSEVHIDWRVFLFTACVALITGFLFGVAPALQTSSSANTEALKSGGRAGTVSVSQRLRRILVVGEVAFAVLLVTAAGLLIRSLWTLSHLNPGFHAEHILTARITPDQSFCSDEMRCLSFYRNVLEQVKATPGVSGAALINTLPLNGRVSKRSLEIENFITPAGEDYPLFWLNVITPGYFNVMSMHVLSGRAFTDADTSSAPVAIITAETAHTFWPGQDAVGKHIRLLGDNDWRTVVGVIPNVRAYDMQHDAPTWIGGAAYIPYDTRATLEDRHIPAEMTIALRTSSEDSRIAATLRETVTKLNAEAPVSEVRTMDSVLSEAVSTPASTAVLMAVFAGLALVLGTIGIYGVLSFLVSNRTREIGVRMALGAQRSDVLRSVLGEGAKLTVAGIALGLTGAFVLMRVLSDQLYGVSAKDPLTFSGVAIVVALVAFVACYIPARKAMNVDPLVALRYE